MKTKQIFNQEGVQVWETDNKDVRGKEWHITDEEGNGCSVGFKPEMDTIWLKTYLQEYMRERMESLEGSDESLPTNE